MTDRVLHFPRRGKEKKKKLSVKNVTWRHATRTTWRIFSQQYVTNKWRPLFLTAERSIFGASNFNVYDKRRAVYRCVSLTSFVHYICSSDSDSFASFHISYRTLQNENTSSKIRVWKTKTSQRYLFIVFWAVRMRRDRDCIATAGQSFFLGCARELTANLLFLKPIGVTSVEL